MGLPDYNKNQKKKLQLGNLLVGIIGIIGIYFLSSFTIDTYRSLDKIGQIHFSELFASVVGIIIFVTKRKFKDDRLEYFELFMLVIVGIIAGVNLLPPDIFNPNLVIILSIIALVIWFVYFGLNRYLGEDKKINKTEFLQIFLFFIALTIIIIVGFNMFRVYDLFKSGTI